MGIKAALSKPFAKFIVNKINKWKNNPIQAQEIVFKDLLAGAKNTIFGKEHNFQFIQTHSDFVKNVPIKDYEDFRGYIDQIIEGKKDVLWKGQPIYFCKTSGTTSGVKYIPITKESMPNHIDSARNAILCYIAETGNTKFVDGKMIFLQGSPELSKKGAINIGRLSGIVAHHVPNYLQKNRLPSLKTNSIQDWETKVDAIIEETLPEKMTLISGIPSWVQMYFEKLQEKTGKKIKDIFPDFSLFIYGGVNYEPYHKRFEDMIGKSVDSIEVYPASEGFIAYQDSQKASGMLLNVASGIFYEFIPVDEIDKEQPTRLTLKDVEVGKNYALILSTNAGLWAYNIGDTVKFTSTKPYRIIVSGRIKHYTSAFGEHVIAEEVEKAMKNALNKFPCSINEFMVAPQVNNPDGGLPYHEWFIEFNEKPTDFQEFNSYLDELMRECNIYYKDLLDGNILQQLKITCIQKDGFNNYMKSQGKLGGQNKIPRLTNDRKIANILEGFIE